MRPGYRPGRIDLRTLDGDDIDGICSIYEPDRDLPAAQCEPRHGFSREREQATRGCSPNGAPTSPRAPGAARPRTSPGSPGYAAARRRAPRASPLTRSSSALRRGVGALRRASARCAVYEPAIGSPPAPRHAPCQERTLRFSEEPTIRHVADRD